MLWFHYVLDGSRKRNNLRPTLALPVPPWETIPLLALKSAVLRLMIKHEGKISKAFFSCGTPRFKNIFLKIYILTAVLYPVLTSETGNLLLLGPTSGKPNVRMLGPTENLSKVQGCSKQPTHCSDAGFFFFHLGVVQALALWKTSATSSSS